jgi:ABC-type phosphate/phosphonate transport system substrate-binding protein
MRKTLLLLLASLLSPLPAAAAPATIVVCYPGGPVNPKDANGAMASMLRVIERVGQWQENTFASVFTSKTDECKQLMSEHKPKFAITSLGLYLELRGPQHFFPLSQPKIKGETSEHYRVIAQKGKYKSLDELKGKTLGGTVLEEETFIGKIVFAGKIDPAKFFALKPSNLAIRSLRALDKGELDAVILNGQQFGGLESLNLENPVETVFTSGDIPLMGVVANSTTSTAEERGRFGQALAGMCEDTEGKKLCDLFGVESFATVDPAVFEPVQKLWQGGK